MTSRVSKFAFMFAVACAPPLLRTSDHSNPSPCLPPSAASANMLDTYQWADTTTDDGISAWRRSNGLPSISVSQISMVSDTTICRRAVVAFNTILKDKHTLTPSVNLIKYGTTRYIIGDPSYTVGEWTYEVVADTSFHKVAIAGR
jgi:hypothetical protein